MDKAMPLLRGEEGEMVGGQPGKKNREKELEKKSREKEPERSIGKNKKSLKSKKETRDA